MDRRVEERIDLKMEESLDLAGEIMALARSLAGSAADAGPFALGILAGRLYNSFYYQSHRILGRDPSPAEFADFVSIISRNRERFVKRLKGG